MTQRLLGGWESPSPHPHPAPRWLGGCGTVLAVPKAHSLTFALPDALRCFWERAADTRTTEPS